jgi:hypothetical protein
MLHAEYNLKGMRKSFRGAITGLTLLLMIGGGR